MLSSENRLGVPLYRLSNEATKSSQRKTGSFIPEISDTMTDIHGLFSDSVPIRVP